MSALWKHVGRFVLILLFFGWVHYQGWYALYYSTLPEKYAYPASLSGPCDPHWGFWFW
jgi:hypothetical protein